MLSSCCAAVTAVHLHSQRRLTAISSAQQDSNPTPCVQVAKQCYICHLPVKRGQDQTKTLCQHTYHAECLRCWQRVAPRPTCPVCRKSLYALCLNLSGSMPGA